MQLEREYYQERRGHSNALYYTGRKLCESENTDPDYEKGFAYLQDAAKSGHDNAAKYLEETFYKLADKAQNHSDVNCQFYIGLMSLEGYYDRDIPYALKWLKKAAQAGHYGAQLKLYQLYRDGYEEGLQHEIRKDPEKAFEWLSFAAQRENITAQYELGRKYSEGKDTTEDHEKGLRYLKRAADAGHVDAQYRIGTTILRFKGGADELNQEAVFWLSRAADREHVLAQLKLGDLYSRKIKGQDYNQSFSWYRRAGENGNSNAQLRLGEMYYLGKGVEKNYENAWLWLVEAYKQIPLIRPNDIEFMRELTEDMANAGNPEAMFQLGWSYLSGSKVFQRDKNPDKGWKWLEGAAEKENADALYHLGDMYKSGEHIDQDFKKASEYFHKAARQGHANAQFELAQMYHRGYGVAEDLLKAASLYEKGAEQGHTESQFHLGTLYFEGSGVEKNMSTAEEWLCSAAVHGSYNAQNYLGKFMYSENRNRVHRINPRERKRRRW